MTDIKRKKVTKARGHRTHGYGSQKKHRGKGSRGGTGMAGSKKHRTTFMLKYNRNHIGKKGFTSKIYGKIKTINLFNIEKLADGAKKIDLEAFGIQKVLGRGEIKKPIEVTAMYFSSSAKVKIEAAGGKAIGTVMKIDDSEETVEDMPEELTEGEESTEVKEPTAEESAEEKN